MDIDKMADAEIEDRIIIHVRSLDAAKIHAWLNEVFAKQEDEKSYTLTIAGYPCELLMYQQTTEDDRRKQGHDAADAALLRQQRGELAEFLLASFPGFTTMNANKPPHQIAIELLATVRQAIPAIVGLWNACAPTFVGLYQQLVRAGILEEKP